MSHSYYRHNAGGDNSSQDSSTSSNSVLDALLAGISNNKNTQRKDAAPETMIPIVTRDLETTVESPVESPVETYVEAPVEVSVPDVSDARVETDSDVTSEDSSDDSFEDSSEDSNDSLPPLIEDSESESDDLPPLEEENDDNVNDVNNLNKCNFVVKVMNPGSTEPTTVFSKSAELAEGEDMFAKLKEITKDTPYGSIVSDLVGQVPEEGLLTSSDPALNFMNDIFGLKPFDNKINQTIKNEIKNDIKNNIKNDPFNSIFDKILAPTTFNNVPVMDYGSKIEKDIMSMFDDFMSPTMPFSTRTPVSRQTYQAPPRKCGCTFCNKGNLKPASPMSYAPMAPPAPKRYDTMVPLYSTRPIYSTRPLVQPKPVPKKSDPLTDILMGLAAITLIGGTAMLLDSMSNKDKVKKDQKTENAKKTENTKKTETAKKTGDDEESVEISTSRSDEEEIKEPEVVFTPEDYKFFKEHFRTFNGNVNDLSPTFQSMYYEIQEELEQEKKEKEEWEAEQRAKAAEMEKPYEAPVVGYTSEGKEIRLRQDGMLETDTSVSGAQFNQMFENCSLVKLTNATSCHNGFQFVEGLNVDFNDFKYDEECGPDGLYFCRESDAENWFNYGHSDMKYVWDVTIPDDARVCVYERKIKADKFILSNKRTLASMAASKMRQMLYTGESTSTILSYLQNNYSSDLIDEPEVVQSLVDMVEMRPDSFAEMDDYLKVHEVCATAAKLYDRAYLYMDQDDFDCDDTLVLQCVYTNPQIFSDIEEEHKTQSVCVAAFEGDVRNYEFIPDEFKTVAMTKDYLFTNPEGTSNVPASLKNHPELIDLVLECNPYAIKEIEYKNLTKDRCMRAVEEDGMNISSIPFAMLDYDICLEATKSSPYAYASVPMQYRDQHMAETLVEYHPDALADLPANLITYEMIKRVVMDDSAHLKKLDFDGIHAPLENMIVYHLYELIDYDPMIVVYLPKRMVSNDDALRAIEINERVFWRINQKFTDLDFVVGAVKSGVAFRAIPRDYLTMDLLKELVRSRDGLIDEIPKRYLSDVLYIEAIKAYDYDVDRIEPQYMTVALQNFLSQNRPESVQAQNLREMELEMELERSMMN